MSSLLVGIPNATDDDSKFRVSCGAVRLVGYKQSGESREYTNYNPIGTLEDASVLLRNKPDDPALCTVRHEILTLANISDLTPPRSMHS